MHAHNSLLVDAQSCEVVGLVNQILHYRRPAPKGETKRQRRQRPERESHLWKRAVAGLPVLPAGVTVTDVSDRGSDLTEYLDYEVRAQREFIVRSCHNRNLAYPSLDGTELKLHNTLRQLTPQATQILSVRTEHEGWRQAEVGLAWQSLSVQPPTQARGEHGREPLILTGVIVREITAPQGVDPVEWILLTNRVVTCTAEAQQVVADYARRWIIEEYHKALKTGCGIETLQLTTRHGLENAIASMSVLAVHVLNLRHLARDEHHASLPAHQHDNPLKVRLAAHHAKHTDWKAMTVWEYYVAVARLGGYVLNPRQRPPGWQILWRGYIRLNDMAMGANAIAQGERCVQT
jgi:Transposase DDE domain